MLVIISIEVAQGTQLANATTPIGKWDQLRTRKNFNFWQLKIKTYYLLATQAIIASL